MSNSQAGQDEFVINVMKKKQNGFFLEIGTNDPIHINNTYILEKEYNWRGFLIEYDPKWESSYVETRPNSIYTINDARKIDYKKLFETHNAPKNFDYLQIDLEVDNKSTIDTLEILNNNIFKDYKFATVTFDHDIYRGDFYNTRLRSREIFEQNGYFLLYPDVNTFEDWYVHPDLVDIEYINKILPREPYLISKANLVGCPNELEYNSIINHIKNNS